VNTSGPALCRRPALVRLLCRKRNQQVIRTTSLANSAIRRIAPFLSQSVNHMQSTEIGNSVTPAHTHGAASLGAHGSGSAEARPRAVRRRLPDERLSTTHRFSVGGHKGYLIVGLYPDGEPGELFITMAKEGSTVSGLVSSIAQVVSVALQHGVPLGVFCDKFAHTRFEPSGFTGNPEIPIATSIMDYLFRWLRLRFVDKTTQLVAVHAPVKPNVASLDEEPAGGAASAILQSSDAPLCAHCGSLTKRNGACFVCVNCGSSTGCG
jgi:ribonucleoside-diphosphate reductase alpha chain